MLKRLPPGKVQEVLLQISRRQGNQHVQRVVSALQAGADRPIPVDGHQRDYNEIMRQELASEDEVSGRQPPIDEQTAAVT